MISEQVIFLDFGLVSLFNGISTFVGYLMPKPFSKKNSRGTIACFGELVIFPNTIDFMGTRNELQDFAL